MSKPAPGYAPIYAAALYPDLVKIARDFGYALAVHGSLQRDFDLIAVPRRDPACEPADMVAEIKRQFVTKQRGKPESREHGRLIYTLAIGFGECFIDLSFMPRVGADK